MVTESFLIYKNLIFFQAIVMHTVFMLFLIQKIWQIRRYRDIDLLGTVNGLL